MMYSSLGGIEILEQDDLSKEDFRQSVWDYLDENELVRLPLPVYNRIPNFIGNTESGERAAQLPEFTCAHTVVVTPDKPQERIRFLTLKAGKKLLVPTPDLRKGLFNLVEREEDDDLMTLRFKSQPEGLRVHSYEVGLDSKVNIDLVILGSVAVSLTGKRIGKGEGFGDIEYAMMKAVKAVDDSAKIITTVHDCQVFDDFPERLFMEHDVPVDIIVTPTQVIEVKKPRNRPQGINWHILTSEKFQQVPVLSTLYEKTKQ